MTTQKIKLLRNYLSKYFSPTFHLKFTVLLTLLYQSTMIKSTLKVISLNKKRSCNYRKPLTNARTNVVHSFCNIKQLPKKNHFELNIKTSENQKIGKNKKMKILIALLLFGTAATSIYHAGLFELLNGSKRDDSPQKFAKQLKNYYLKQFEEDSYISGKSVENKMRSIFQTQTNQIELILGMEGIGKSSAAKKLITQKRNRGEKVYYINLREDYFFPSGKTYKDVFQKLEALIQAISREYDGSVKAMLVIDDINMLSLIKERGRRYEQQNLIINLSKKGVKVILISSEGYFYKSIWQGEMFRKHINKTENVIWMMDQQQNRQIILKKAAEFNIEKEYVEKVIDFGLPLRESLKLIVQINRLKKNGQHSQINDFLNAEIRMKRNKILSKAQNILDANNFDQKAANELFKGFCESKPHAYVSSASYHNCYQLQDKIIKIRGPKSTETTVKVFEEFDKQNLIIFCYPRSRIFMNLLKEMLAKPNAI